MHEIEPFYNWIDIYQAAEDERSPFYGRKYNEIYFENKIYNYLIHPQWDDIGSETLFIKIIYCDYHFGFCVIELFGEWNDAVNNDIMYLKRDVADVLISNGINKFILIGDNVLNFHSSDDCYYEEWFDDVDSGWVCLLNFREHVMQELQDAGIDYYLLMGGKLQLVSWRTYQPQQLYNLVNGFVQKRLENL